eukprot:7437667-Alexandrium_andersonii.AAC.1
MGSSIASAGAAPTGLAASDCKLRSLSCGPESSDITRKRSRSPSLSDACTGAAGDGGVGGPGIK